jgi:lipid-binding SYLF domain-containing protein
MSKTRAACIAIVCFLVGCASTPKTAAQRDTLKADADATIAMITADDPSLRLVLDSAVGYVVFPDVKQGGFVVGGSSGRGVLYEQGLPMGFAQLNQASIGAQAGGQSFSEIVVLRDQRALDRVKESKFAVGGQASAVAIRSGAGAAARFEEGVAVFVKPKGGAMLNVSLTGQRIKYSG